jgi:hypothetical protein
VEWATGGAGCRASAPISSQICYFLFLIHLRHFRPLLDYYLHHPRPLPRTTLTEIWRQATCGGRDPNMVPAWYGAGTFVINSVWCLPAKSAIPSPLGYVGWQPLTTIRPPPHQQPTTPPAPITTIQLNDCITLSSLRDAVTTTAGS